MYLYPTINGRLRLPLVAIALVLIGAVFANANAAVTKVRFGVPPWPGVTVKSEVAVQVLNALGYKTEQKSLGVPIILNGLKTHDLDVYMGGWYPVEASMIDSLVKQKKVAKITANVSDALAGLAVPEYVHAQGIDSINDLRAHAKRFDHKIYGIEAGSGTNEKINKAIKENRYQLGDWKLVESSTAGMLSQVGRAVRRKQWIVFYGWRPHWMNITYKIHYLTAPKGSDIVGTQSKVYTVVTADLPKNHPNLARFLRQFKVADKTQSQWIYDYSYQKKPVKDVARQWIAAHPATVKRWLAGVKTVDGKPAFAAVKASP